MIDCITDLVTQLEVNVDDEEIKETLIRHINDLSSYACLQQEDKGILNSLMDYLLVIYLRVGELDYKSVEYVLDTIAMASVTVKDCRDT